MTSLIVENLSIEFGGVHAVDNVSFEVAPGETFAIIGPNGAGKSTIFNLISRIYEPSTGSIHYGDRNLLEVDFPVIHERPGDAIDAHAQVHCVQHT